jgi:PAS domain S-box-containing protein
MAKHSCGAGEADHEEVFMVPGAAVFADFGIASILGTDHPSQETVSSDLARSIVETLHEPLLVLSPDLTVRAASPAFYEYFETAESHTVGRPLYDLGSGQWDIPALRTLLEDVLPRESVFYDFKVEHTFESIGRRVLLLNARQLNHSQLILLGIRDATDANAAERALRESRQRLASLYDSAKVGISEIGADGRFASANNELCRIMGRSRSELLGLSIEDVTHPEDLPRTLELVGTLFETGQPVSLDKRYVRPDGSAIYANSTASLLHGAERPAMVVVTIDLTERRAAELALRSSEARLRALVSATSDVVYRMSPDWKRMYRLESRGFLADHAPDEPLDDLTEDTNWLEKYIPEDDRPAVLAAIEQAKADKAVFEFEHRVTQADGSVGWTHSRAVPLCDHNGNIVEWFGAAHDVTRRKEAERALQHSEAKLRLLTNSLPVLISYVDTDYRYVFNNHTYEQWFGVQSQDINGRHMRDVLGESAYQNVLPHVRKALSGEMASFEAELDYQSAGLRHVNVVYMPDTDQHGVTQGMFAMITDVTDRHRAEQALRLSEQRYRLLVESAREYAMLMIDPRGTVVSWNVGAERLFGYTASEMVGQPSEALYTDQDRADGVAQRKRERALAEGQASTDQWYRRKDGSLFWANGVLRPLEDDQSQGFVKILRDQTKQKAHEEHLRIVMAELNHRVKNTLAVVQSIATQTMQRASSLSAFRPDFEKRLRSIARAHNLLTRTSWTGVTLSSVIESEVGAASGDVRITSGGPDVTLSPEMTLALHMVLHELTTNAHKYGCLSHARGALSIDWKVQGPGDDRTLELSWHECCPTPIAKPGADGFGSRLIEQLIVYELGGEIDREYQPDGLRFRLRVPLRPVPAGLDADQPSEPNANAHEPDRATAPSPKAVRPSVLLVEDMAMLAMAMKDELEARGYAVLGPAPSVARARELVRRVAPAMAVLDVNLGDEQVYPLIPVLKDAGVPIVLLTGHDAASVPKEFADIPVLSKPVELDDLERFLRRHARASSPGA